MDTHSNCKIQLPKEEKLCLGLLQQYLLFQVNIVKGKTFTLDVVIADSSKVSLCLPTTRHAED
jgi:hypothetical protein